VSSSWVEDGTIVLSQNVANQILSETVSHHRRMGNFSGLNKTAFCLKKSKRHRTLISLNLHHYCMEFVHVLQIQLSGLYLHFEQTVTGSSTRVMTEKKFGM
jgi:hypothetical protein